MRCNLHSFTDVYELPYAHYILRLKSFVVLLCSAALSSFSVRHFLREWYCFTNDIVLCLAVLQQYLASKGWLYCTLSTSFESNPWGEDEAGDCQTWCMAFYRIWSLAFLLCLEYAADVEFLKETLFVKTQDFWSSRWTSSRLFKNIVVGTERHPARAHM